MSAYITPKQISYFISVLHKAGKSDNTITSYSRNIKKLVLFLDGSELSKPQMVAYKKWLQDKGFKHRTINTYIAAANYFCEIMKWQDMKLKLDPLDYEELQERRQISSESYKKLVYTALQNDKERLAMMIQVLCHTGLRFCELNKLTVESLRTGYIEVIRKKQNVKLEIPEIIKSDLSKYTQHQNIISGEVFQTKNGNTVNRSNFRRELKNLCILAGVDEEAGSIQCVKNVVLDAYPYLKLKND
ncbi:MAG: tyrosine-type recombinase/integrase [Lachnospiraceae bacterium]|nr:tyrosine-type recombinase/integrase [Lachnospiraceae bacterium]